MGMKTTMKTVHCMRVSTVGLRAISLMGGGGQEPDGSGRQHHPDPAGQSFEGIHDSFV